MICSNKNIYIHYGETVSFDFTTDDITAIEGTFYVAMPGEAPVITETFTITAGVGNIVLDELDTDIPLGEYNYSIVVNGKEYPGAESELPKFIVTESVKNIEVS